MIPKLRNGLKEVSNIQSVIVFCGGRYLNKFKEIFSAYDIVKLVSDDFNDILPKIGELMAESAQA